MGPKIHGTKKYSAVNSWLGQRLSFAVWPMRKKAIEPKLIVIQSALRFLRLYLWERISMKRISMKMIAIEFTILFLGIASEAQVKSETKNSLAPFLSYKQLQALTAAEQRSYIKDVKEFVRNLTKNNRYFVENSDSQESETRAPAADRDCMSGQKDFSSTSAQDLRTILEADIRHCTGLVEKTVAADSNVGRAMPKDGKWNKAAVDKYLAAENFKPGDHRGRYLPSAVPVILGLKERVLEGQRNAKTPKEQEQWGGLVIQLNGVLSEFDTHQPKEGSYDTKAMATATAEVKAVYKTLDDDGKRGKKFTKLAGRGTQPAVAKPGRSAVEVAAVTNPPAAKPAPPTLARSSNCFSSGFVVARGADGFCPPVRDLPADMRWADPEKIGPFKCSDGNQVICNPVLFGYTSTCRDFVENTFWRYLNDCQWKPFCVAPAGNTTAECFRIPSDEVEKGSVQTVWNSTVKNKDSKTIYEAYINSIQKLCEGNPNVETNRGDIEMASCQSEKAKFEARIAEKYNPSTDGGSGRGTADSKGAQ